MNGAESLVKTLVAAGVDVCFANPGTSEMHFVAALDDNPDMRCVLGLFEGVVTGAADGYARMAERPAATLLHLGSERRAFLQFDFLAFPLAATPAAAYLDSDNVVARVNLPNMAYPPAAKVEIYERALSGLLTLETDGDRREKYIDFIDMYADLDENELAIYRARHAQEDDLMASLTRTLREEGRQEGAHEGAARVLLRQLALRFGEEAATGVRSRVDAADLDAIMAWSDRVLTASSLEDVFL